jgi:hypothetical protein
MIPLYVVDIARQHRAHHMRGAGSPRPLLVIAGAAVLVAMLVAVASAIHLVP